MAEACTALVEDSDLLLKMANDNPSIGEKIVNIIKGLISKIRKMLKLEGTMDVEIARTLKENADNLRDIVDKWDTAVMEGLKNQNAKQAVKETTEQKNNTATNDDVQYSLKKYSQHQIDNWSNSKNIIVYGNEQQLRNFINDARNGKNLSQKIYFGKIPENLAIRIKQDTGIDVESYNCTLRASEIRKIFNDHGNEQTESKRGQRAITEDDFVSIPQIIQAPDEIRLSDVLFEGKPVIQFIKTVNGKTTVVAYVSKKHLDLTVQTMYSGKNKRNLATAAGEQAPANTPEANVGTVPTNSISQTNEKSNTQFSARDTEYLQAVENNDLETAQHNRVFIESNKISTVFGRNNFREYIARQINKGNLVRIKKRSNTSSEANVKTTKDYRSIASNNNISQNETTVNNQSMQNDENNSTQLSARDTEYLQAVENNDLETAQRMVDEVAKENGYTIRAYHGTLSDKFTVFDKSYIGSRFSFDDIGFFFIDRKSIAEDYASSEFNASKKGIVFDVYLKTKKPLKVNKQFCLSNGLGNPFMDNDVINVWDNYSDYLKEEAEAIDADGIILDDGMSKMIVVFDSEQIKSAEPVTYDDNGNVIPLSKRFNKVEEDIRYSARDNRTDYTNIDLSTLDDKQLKVYNNRGWANSLFTDEDRKLLNEKFNELNTRIKQRMDNVLADGSRIVEVNNKLVLMGGTFEDPIIHNVLVINADNETEADIIKEFIYNESSDYRSNQKEYSEFLEYVQIIEGEKFVRTYNADGFRYFKGRNTETATLPRNFKNYGYTEQFQNRRGDNSKAEQRISNEVDNTQYDIERGNMVTNRMLLADALESTAQNSTELANLRAYKEGLQRLDEDTEKLNNINVKLLKIAKKEIEEKVEDTTET